MDSTLQVSKSIETLEKENRELVMEISELKKIIIRQRLERKYLLEKLHSDYSVLMSKGQSKLPNSLVEEPEAKKSKVDNSLEPIVAIISPTKSDKDQDVVNEAAHEPATEDN